MKKRSHLLWFLPLLNLLWLSLMPQAQANPAFARQYSMSCNACHAAFPRLNAFGEKFLADNIRMDGWKEQLGVPTGDDMLMLPKVPSLSVRAQAFYKVQEMQNMDLSNDITPPGTGAANSESSGDFQAPYLIKLISGAPLSEHISYYFYAILAEKGGNGEAVVEDAWVSHDDLFGSGIGMLLGQFQVSDVMFPRETRMTVQDFLAYRMAGITYERGALFEYEVGPVSLALGSVNGDGIGAPANSSVNSTGYKRPDKLFDSNQSKSSFGRIGLDVGEVMNIGMFGYSGQHPDTAGATKQITGIDISGDVNGELFWFAQYLDNQWDDYTSPGTSSKWNGGFVGIDYIPGGKHAYSLLYNFADAGDLKNLGEVTDGIETSSLTLSYGYYFMRNVKGVVEANLDMLEKETWSAADQYGHFTNENYLLLGFDLAF